MQVLLSKLFGASSQKATAISLKADQCREVLAQVVDELYFYLEENIQTDELHRLMLLSGLVAAKESLKEEDFYLGYIEGITRFSLLLR